MGSSGCFSNLWGNIFFSRGETTETSATSFFFCKFLSKTATSGNLSSTMQSLQVRPGFLGSLNGGADIWVSEWKKAELLRSSPQLRGVCKGTRRVVTINAGGRIGGHFALLFFSFLFSVGLLNNVGNVVAHFEVSVPAKIARIWCYRIWFSSFSFSSPEFFSL